MLWFDVEEGYNTTSSLVSKRRPVLWFDVEEGYNTTANGSTAGEIRCGLM